jgi:hypothetical protein
VIGRTLELCRKREGPGEHDVSEALVQLAGLLCLLKNLLRPGLSLQRSHRAVNKPLLDSSDSFVLQNAHDYAAIFSLSFRRFIVANLVRLSHRTWRQHSGEWNVALLKQDIRHVVGAILTELLV